MQHAVVPALRHLGNHRRDGLLLIRPEHHVGVAQDAQDLQHETHEVGAERLARQRRRGNRPRRAARDREPVALPSSFEVSFDSMKQNSIWIFGKASSALTRAFVVCGSSLPLPKTHGLHQSRKGKCVRQCCRRSKSVGIKGVGLVFGA